MDKLNIQIPNYFTKKFTYPDGQPHICIKPRIYKGEEQSQGDLEGVPTSAISTWEEFADAMEGIYRRRITYSIYAKIYTPNDLFDLGLILDAFRSTKSNRADTTINCCIEWLLGARMDKRTEEEGVFHPLTLEVVCRILHLYEETYNVQYTFREVHNPEAVKDIFKRLGSTKEHLYEKVITKDCIRKFVESKRVLLLFPDAGAFERYRELATICDFLVAKKKRDSISGELVKGKFTLQPIGIQAKYDRILIVDDIIDGGATITKLTELIAEQYKEAEVDLPEIIVVAAHGIFSKGVGRDIFPYVSEFHIFHSRVNTEVQKKQVPVLPFTNLI